MWKEGKYCQHQDENVVQVVQNFCLRIRPMVHHIRREMREIQDEQMERWSEVLVSSLTLLLTDEEREIIDDQRVSDIEMLCGVVSCAISGCPIQFSPERVNQAIEPVIDRLVLLSLTGEV